MEKFKPDALLTTLDQLFKRTGHYIVYNAPRNPEYNPSELLNGRVKRFVRQNCHHERVMSELYDDLLAGMNGGTSRRGVAWKPIDAEMCTNWWRKCLGKMNADIKLFKLGDETTTIENLWTDDCGFDCTTFAAVNPFTQKRIAKFDAKFTVIV